MTTNRLFVQRQAVWSGWRGSFAPVHAYRNPSVVTCALRKITPVRSAEAKAGSAKAGARKDVSVAGIDHKTSIIQRPHIVAAVCNRTRAGLRERIHVPRVSLGGAGESVPLPPDSNSDNNDKDKQISKGISKKVENSFSDSTQTLLRLLINAGVAYDRALQTNPILTKATTCFITFMIGDIIAQSFQGAEPLDIMRMLRLGLYGLMIDGPFGHVWYTWLDKTVYPEDPNSTKAVLTKTAADQLIWSVAMTPVFFATLRILEGRPDLILSTIERKVVPTLLANYMVWPLAHLINFKFVPSSYRLLYNNIVCIAWTTFMSYITYQAVHHV